MKNTNRRGFLKTIGSAMVAGMTAQRGSAASSSPRRKPNILFIAVDDLRPNLGCYGDQAAITPNLDRLASRGVQFNRAYCQQAVCNPSRQSLLTGVRPDGLKVWDLKTHFRTTAPDLVTLPEYFKQQGYFAQSMGKIFHGEAPMADPPSWSVAEQFEYTPKRDDYILERNHVSRGAEKADAMEFVEAKDDDYPDGKVANAAVSALAGFARTSRDQPFFLAVGFRKPHLPFTAPKKYWEMHAGSAIPPPPNPVPPSGAPAVALHDSVELRGYLGMPPQGRFNDHLTHDLRRGYYAAVTYTDAQIGHVLTELDRTGLAGNTLVVFWVDHGFHLGEQGLWTKTTNYELDTHVPLIIARPGDKNAGKKCDALVELLDVFPTVCDLAGVKAPRQLQGVSLRPWLDAPDKTGKTAAFSQFPRPWFYKGAPEFMGYAVRTDTHRFIEWRNFKSNAVVERELYRYATDQPVEVVNLAGQPSEQKRVAELSALIAGMRNSG